MGDQHRGHGRPGAQGGPADGVQHILDTYDWRNSIDAARICYDELKALGKEHAPQPTTTEAPAPAAPVETAPAPQAEMLLSDGQRQGLCGHAKRGGADTSGARATLWGYLLNAGRPVGTRDLTEQQAQVLIDTLGSWNNEQAVTALKEAREAFDTEGLPF
ncbi:hypothetical protein ACFSC4_18820 [Deinococcus malanensis]|uniref:hypothetical protein n=1 Tax=Deinococcus malanensis TaxID=1706855 RepID=UPI0036302FF4